MKLGQRILKSIACVALLVLASTTSSARAGEQVPFRAEYETQFTVAVNFPIASVSALGGGKATHLGRMVVESISETVNLLTGEGIASYQFTAANGDTITVEFVLIAVPTPTGLAVSGSWEITAGSGRFAGASGLGKYTARADFAGPDFGVVRVRMDGSISSPGSLK